MRILMLDNEFPPLGGGTGVVNYYLLEKLSGQQDVWVDLITSSCSRHNYEIERFAPNITIYKVPVNNRNIHHATNLELLRYTWRGLLLSWKLQRRQAYDLSFAFAGVPAGGISYALKLLFSLPYLVSLQGPDVPGFEARYNYLYPVLKPLLRRIWNSAGVVTAISQQHRRLAWQTLPDLNIAIINNGVDIQQFQPPIERGQKAEVNILCVGRLIERKGQCYLLQAFANLWAVSPYPLHLTLVGTGDAEEALQHLAARLGVSEAVTFTGFISRKDVPAVYHQADIFVLPSQNEGMSIALLEAMASGLPVIVTDTGGTIELVKDGLNGYIVLWADAPALAQALALLVQDQRLRRQMGEESRRIAESFAWSTVAEKYLSLCHRITILKEIASTLEIETSASGEL